MTEMLIKLTVHSGGMQGVLVDLSEHKRTKQPPGLQLKTAGLFIMQGHARLALMDFSRL
jgi:hypothetical protein